MENDHLIDKIVKGFRKVSNELEEFQLQFALGKAEAKDKYEELKKKFNTTLHEAELKIESGKEMATSLRTKFDELRVQLALGKAETKEVFEAQRKTINAKIHEIEVMIKSNPTLVKMHDTLLEEFEKLKIKFEILAVNFNLNTNKPKDSIEKRREEMDKIIKGLQDDLAKRHKPEEPTAWENFQEEIGQAYKHLKSAFVK